MNPGPSFTSASRYYRSTRARSITWQRVSVKPRRASCPWCSTLCNRAGPVSPPNSGRTSKRRKPVTPACFHSPALSARFEPEKPDWANHAAKIAEGLVHVDPDSLGDWVEALEPAHRFFTPRLSLIFSDKSRTVAERMLATQALAVYLAGDPARLAELLLVAEPDQFLSLFPVAETRKSEVLPVLKAQLTETNTPSWNDPALDASWTKPDSALKRTIESAHGLLDDRFAFCQTMGLDDCRELSEKLRESGYRLVRFRPLRRRQVREGRRGLEPGWA